MLKVCASPGGNSTSSWLYDIGSSSSSSATASRRRRLVPLGTSTFQKQFPPQLASSQDSVVGEGPFPGGKSRGRTPEPEITPDEKSTVDIRPRCLRLATTRGAKRAAPPTGDKLRGEISARLVKLKARGLTPPPPPRKSLYTASSFQIFRQILLRQKLADPPAVTPRPQQQQRAPAAADEDSDELCSAGWVIQAEETGERPFNLTRVNMAIHNSLMYKQSGGQRSWADSRMKSWLDQQTGCCYSRHSRLLQHSANSALMS